MVKGIDGAQWDKLNKTFDAIDDDGNGEISLQEFITAMTTGDMEGELDTKQAEEMFHNLDVDGDHMLNKSELMLSVTNKVLCDRQERLYSAFVRLDLNGDGVIDKDEMQAALNDSNVLEEFKFLGSLDDIIKAADLNGDGQIDLQEFYLAMDPHGGYDKPDTVDQSADQD